MFEIPDSWSWKEVRDIAAPSPYACIGGPFGSKLTQADYVDEPAVPVIRGSNLSGPTGFEDSGFAFVSEEKKQKDLLANLAYPGDLVFTQRGTLGQVGRIPEGAKYAEYVLSQSQMKLTVDEDQVDPAFAYAFFRSPYAQERIKRSAITTGVPHINLGILRSFPVPIPTLAEQHRIASTLTALDDKIQLNQQMNRTLVEIVQTIFRAWFVDFEGQTDLVESELGPIPRGWRIVSLGDLAAEVRESVQPGDVRSQTPYIGLADMPPGSIGGDSWGTASEVTSTKHKFKPGDILFGRLRPYFKKIAVPSFGGICSSDIMVLRTKQENNFGVVFGLLLQDSFIDFTERMSTGTRMPRVAWSSMATYKLVVPPANDKPEVFNQLVRTSVERINHGIRQSRTLADLRDTLLPKLISGEIRVPEAAEMANEVMEASP